MGSIAGSQGAGGRTHSGNGTVGERVIGPSNVPGTVRNQWDTAVPTKLEPDTPVCFMKIKRPVPAVTGEPAGSEVAG